ncbi:cytochrome P450 3A24 [Elysia marginata]|uniref:Cytochrome P450 3A24 n=1 Tax=Elysia marginata TaxID=1093978 RepID=A0AAV4HH97_9GAST|nr:cytochrome P450 3A24 [Elysia marginata]
MREHGPTVGIIRDLPVLVTRDLDLLKQVLVKDFNNFVNRNDQMATRSLIGKGVFFLKDYDWKRIRQLMSPSFSTGRLKRISAHVQEAANHLSQAFQKSAESGSRVKLLHITGQYSTSIIAKTAFGFQADSIGQEEDDEFTHCVKNIFKKRTKTGFFFIMFLMRFRSFRRLLVFTLGLYFPDPCTKRSNEYFNAILKESIAEREEAERNGSRHVNNDFLQSLVSTKIASEDTISGKTQSEKNDISISNGQVHPQSEKVERHPKKTITKDEVIAQSLITILAAFETTASSLQFCLFKLSQHPEIQEKIFQEILDVVEHENPTHEELSKLYYLEQVINETLRMYPPLPFITREPYETRTYGNVTIPAGSAVFIPIREVHRDATQYPNPDEFDPERFSEENKAKRNPLAFMPFGQGPRICIGMRLAYLELKTALVQVLRKVKVELDDTTVPRNGEDITINYFAFPRPEQPIELVVKLRDNQI